MAALQRKVPVIITLHGSDINDKSNIKYSRLAAALSQKVICVSPKMQNTLKSKKSIVIPCGVDLNIFRPMSEVSITKKINLNSAKKHILFSSKFSRRVKNYPLAKKALSYLKIEYEIIELKNFSRDDVAELLNIVDVALMTSFSEGSPQFIKEAMACNCPIVATNVGDVAEVIAGVEGCYLTTFDPKEIAKKIQHAISFGKRTNGREKIAHFDSDIIANKIIKLYKEILNKNTNKTGAVMLVG